MQRLFFNIATWAIISTSFMTMGLGHHDKIVALADVPAEIRAYAATHFPDNQVVQAIEDKDLFGASYDLTLSGDIKLEFNKKNKITDIESKTKLPDSVIPEKIRAYITGKYPSGVITGWELEGRKQEIRLDNGLDLEFGLNGDFLRIDR